MKVTIIKKDTSGRTYATASTVVNSARELLKFCDKVGYFAFQADLEADFNTKHSVQYVVNSLPHGYAYANH